MRQSSFKVHLSLLILFYKDFPGNATERHWQRCLLSSNMDRFIRGKIKLVVFKIS
ncbi:hypothetical protein HMPREF9103_01798 [Lentilactobacillus parafarraginis F0439]|uniref:Uncharacterized protein n=1 Tax=Lentilactobacillus parafarraginis F0439 TaxID=797515 RepID=G9ZPZ2_9LACO|nr:hypothetical protein HMPREF9103_01798 [Lentilactobacillus parafarraginis F0439]